MTAAYAALSTRTDCASADDCLEVVGGAVTEPKVKCGAPLCGDTVSYTIIVAFFNTCLF